MSSTWTLYATASTDVALRAVDATYAKLEELYESVDLDDGDSAPDLGFLPDVEVSQSPVPTPAAQRTALGKRLGGRIEDAAFTRLAKCKSTILLDRPTSLEEDPTLVSSLKLLLAQLGEVVFAGSGALAFVTGETLAEELERHRDLEGAVKARRRSGLQRVAKPRVEESGEVPHGAADSDTDVGDSDTSLEDSDTSLDDLEDEDDEAVDSAEPDALRRTLAAIAEHPSSRRRASELLDKAPDLVVRVAERLARVGVESDEALAKGVDADLKKVKAARLSLAELLRKASRPDG